MPDKDLIELVEQMRHAQKEYFRTRSGGALDASKRLERRVDEALAERRDTQLKLFSGDD